MLFYGITIGGYRIMSEWISAISNLVNAICTLVNKSREPHIVKKTGTYKNGVKYTYKCCVANWKFNGEGKLTLSNGTTYTGNFVDGEYKGKGRLVIKPNTKFFYIVYIYEGDFDSGKLNGRGKSIIKNFFFNTCEVLRVIG